MLFVYVLPMIMRPADFLNNFTAYVVGMVTYVLMLPTFINVMQIYSMSNLHDISWGNRPTSTPGGTTGQNMLTEDAKKQQKLKNRYMMFRVNALTMWILANGIYALVINSFVSQEKDRVNDGSIGFLEIFACYLAGLIVFKVIFAALHILRFKCRNNCCGEKHQVNKVDLEEQYRKMKRRGQVVGNDSEDERLIQQHLGPSGQGRNGIRVRSGDELDDIDDEEDDQLLQSNRAFLDAMKAAKNKRERQRRLDQRAERLGLAKSALHDDDNDFEFESASEEENMDLMDQGSSALKISQNPHLQKKQLELSKQL